jgi:hypothetical protein
MSTATRKGKQGMHHENSGIIYIATATVMFLLLHIYIASATCYLLHIYIKHYSVEYYYHHILLLATFLLLAISDNAILFQFP